MECTRRNPELIELLQHQTWESRELPVPLPDIITAVPNDRVADTFKKLCDHNILSVPVVDPVTGIPRGIVSVLLLVNHFCSRLDEDHLRRSINHTFDFFSLVIEKRSIIEEHTDTIQSIEQLDAMVTIPNSQASLLKIIDTMVEQKAHRVVIVDETSGKLLRMITQSQMVEYIRNHMDRILPAQRNDTLKHLGIGSRPVITILDSEPAYKAFQLMRENGISGIGVVNQAGQIVGNISVSDVKLLSYDLNFFQSLAFSVKEYLRTMMYKKTVRMTGMPPQSVPEPAIVSVRKDDHLETVFNKLFESKVHRVYILNKEREPVGVISMYDLLKEVVQ